MSNKFSIVDDDNDLYEELSRFVYWLSWRECDVNNVMMEFEDLSQELFLELTKGLKHYSTLPSSEKKKVLKTMMDNRIKELKHRYYSTHRARGNNVVSLDDDYAMVSDAENSEESLDNMQDLRMKLSPIALEVLDAILYRNPRTSKIIELSRIRYENHIPTRGRQNVCPWHVIQPWHVVEICGKPLKAVKEAFLEIEKAWLEVYHGV